MLEKSTKTKTRGCSGGISGIGVIRGIGSRDRGYGDREWTDDRWHKAVKVSNSGGTITDKAV
jgi:hypothetical protein